MKTDLIILLANHAEPLQGFCLANDFTTADDGWIQIVPYGDYPHGSPLGPDGKPLKKNGKIAFPRGVIQRIDNEAGQVLVDQFNGLKATKPNFVGLPWYIGHHDLDPIKYPDPKSYGWITGLANRADGLYAKVDWTPEGKDLVDKKAFKLFSPFFFRAEDTGKIVDGKGVVRPTELKSVAFTNNPNIDVMPLANEAQPEKEPTSQEGAAEFLIANAISDGVLTEADRDTWLQHFSEDFKGATMVLANSGTSEGARKGWETRRANMAAKDPAKAAAKVAAKTAKTKYDPMKIKTRLDKNGKPMPVAPDSVRLMQHPAYKQAIEQGASHEDALSEARGEVAVDKALGVMKRNATAAATAKATPPPLPKVGTPEREALYGRTAPAAAARVAARTYSGYDSSKSAADQGGPSSEAFMQ